MAAGGAALVGLDLQAQRDRLADGQAVDLGEDEVAGLDVELELALLDVEVLEELQVALVSLPRSWSRVASLEPDVLDRDVVVVGLADVDDPRRSG